MKFITSVRKYFFLSLLFTCYYISDAQQIKPLKRLTLSGGQATHFSGDIRGLIVSTEYGLQLKKNWTWYAGIGFTLHDEPGIPVYFDWNNNTIDASKKEATGGIQLTSHIGYDILSRNRHQAGVKLGFLGRYQTTSATSVINIIYPIATNLPYPIYVLENINPQRTVAAGVSGQLYYNFQLTGKIGLGVVAGYQFDSYGDNISQLSLSVTRFLK